MKPLDYAQLDHWKDQSIAKSLAWNKNHLDKEDSVKDAYEAGFNNGWEEAIKMLKLHAGLKLTYGGHKVDKI